MTSVDAPIAETTLLSLSSIKPGANPRRYFDQAKHRELVDSLRLRGMLQPILVRADPATPDSYLIVAIAPRPRRSARMASCRSGCST